MDDNWRMLFNEHTRAPIYTVSHYIAYLRRFVADTAGSRGGSAKGQKESKERRESPSRKKGDPDSIDPLSYFLRKLKLDLKVSYDSFVRDFVRPQNEGLSLLLRLLANLQSPSPPNAGPALNRSCSRLEDYKKSVTDEHDCLLCIKFCLRDKSAVGQLVQQADGLQRLAAGVQGSSSKARITCLEILTLCLLDARGVDNVVEAFTVLKLHTGQSYRFKMLVSMLHTKSPSQVLFQVTCMKLFNTLLNRCPSANQRVYLQHELLSAGLDLQFLSLCAEGDGLEYDDLRREVLEWKTRFIDVDVLLKRLKGSHKDTMDGMFSGQDGPLQVSSRVGSERSSHGVTYFQPEELAGTVELDAEITRGVPRRNHRVVSNGSVLPDFRPLVDDGSHDQLDDDSQNSGPDTDDSDSDFISVSAHHTLRFQQKVRSGGQPRPTDSGAGATPENRFRGNLSGGVQNLASHHHQTVANGNHSKSVVGEFASARRRASGDNILDAYGLVIHRGDYGWRHGQYKGQGQGPQARRRSQEAYSNFKLQYFSTPSMPTRREDGPVGITEEDSPITNGHGGVNGVGDGGLQKLGDFHHDQNMFWSLQYPFNKRALYRGLDSSSGLTDHTATTLPMRGLPSPPGPPAPDVDSLSSDLTVHTPDPDYTPVPSPHGSMRSLQTEVAQVLRDFENTLRAHEPAQSPSVSGIRRAAFV